MIGDFLGNFLKAQRRAVEKLERAGDALQKLRRTPLRRLVIWPEHIPHFGHRRETIVHRGGVTLRFPRITPRPVNAEATFARRVFAGHMTLVVSPSNFRFAHFSRSSSYAI